MVPVGKVGVPVKVGEASGAAPVTSATGIAGFAELGLSPRQVFSCLQTNLSWSPFCE